MAKHEPSCKMLHEYVQSHLSVPAASGETGKYYVDFFSGELFRRIAVTYGGVSAIMDDIFLGISCDDFQTFGNDSYESWPIVGLLLNLDPSIRFLMKNIIPLGFIKGPQKPALLDTFFIPLKNEITRINNAGGATLRRFDGVVVKCRVHIVFISADGPASQLLSRAVGGNGKACCRMCVFHGYYCTVSRHYYYPSKLKQVCERGRGTQLKVFYDVENLPIRTASDIKETLRILEKPKGVRRGEKETLRRDTGIKRRTVLLSFPTVTPYISFPLDTMHLFMNLTKDIMEVLKGENSKLAARGFTEESFIISRQGWDLIDSEMRNIPRGTSLDAFDTPPRTTDHYSKWKAIECRDFLQYYALILLEGHLPTQFLKGLSLLCCVSRLSSNPCLSVEDLEELDEAAKGYVRHFEERYYMYDARRVHLCKSTLHALLHLRPTVELCGPLVGCNQYWVERFIGYRKEKMHAKTLPADSLTESSKLTESCKLFFKNHFASRDDDIHDDDVHDDDVHDDDVHDDDVHDDDVDVVSDGAPKPLLPCDVENLSDSFHSRINTRSLLVAFLRGSEGMTEAEASDAIKDDRILSYGRLRLKTGNEHRVVGAYRGRRHRTNLKRADQFVAAEFETAESWRRDIYYERISKILGYTFSLGAERSTRNLVMLQWADRLQVNAFGEIFKASPLQSCFRNPSVESCDVLLNSIGVLEHKSSHVRNRRTFFIDPQRESYNLLKPGRPSPDNIDRNLRGRV